MDWSYPLYCSCRRNADRVALVGRDGEVTYGELERRVAAVTAGFEELGLAGATVATLSANEPETVELYMALARAGATAVPVNTRLTTAEKRFIFEDSGVSAVVADAEFLAEARGLRDEVAAVRTVIPVRDSDDGPGLTDLRDSGPGRPAGAEDGEERAPATIIYTSGTTGFPKGVVRSHR
ncbi:MAG TPA: class I adenylate-forming enzyme family protein, partial [Solirubrobacterales bacterium]|nr:class I adenylate-forming enzyme family protein [Solirubrobacterales bacterium]